MFDICLIRTSDLCEKNFDRNDGNRRRTSSLVASSLKGALSIEKHDLSDSPSDHQWNRVILRVIGNLHCPDKKLALKKPRRETEGHTSG